MHYGDTKVWPEIPAWESGKYYNPGDVVEYEGRAYRCTQIHKSNVQYTPYTPGFWMPI
ncbi:carbohydrate-binding protein [Corynebacterium diphtheriae]